MKEMCSFGAKAACALMFWQNPTKMAIKRILLKAFIGLPDPSSCSRSRLLPPIIERRKRGTGLSVNHPFSYILSGDSGLHYFTLLAATPP